MEHAGSYPSSPAESITLGRMPAKQPFLSDAWFDMHDAALRGLATPAAANVVNLTVKRSTGPLDLSLHDGVFRRGHDGKAAITVTLPPDAAYSMVVGDPSALMTGVVNGTITLDGDIDAFSSIAAADRDPALQAILNKILAKTAPPTDGASPAEQRAQKDAALEALGAAMRAEARAERDAKRAKANAKAKPVAKAKAKAKADVKMKAKGKPAAKARPAAKSKSKSKGASRSKRR